MHIFAHEIDNRKIDNAEIDSNQTGRYQLVIAGGVAAAYASLGIDPGHLLTASILSAPGSLVIAKLMFPEAEQETWHQGASKEDPLPDGPFPTGQLRRAVPQGKGTTREAEGIQREAPPKRATRRTSPLGSGV